MAREAVRVLDHGELRIRAVMGDDLMVVNAARVSYGARVETLTERDVRLIRFLWRHGHRSPFYHPKIQCEVYAPLMVARQWWRHHVDVVHTDEGSAWNELSRRYVQEHLQFYVPTEWHRRHHTNKQGAEGYLSGDWTAQLETFYARAVRLYEEAIAAGMAAEQARLFLPANGQYTRWIWTASLYAVLQFISLRTSPDAQWEIRQYAAALKELVAPYFPATFHVAFETSD
jgi:thymidylate synthase (FAD)